MSAKNYNEGKIRPSLVVKDMSKAFIELVKIREAGMAKGYKRMNWAESIGTDDAPRFLDENLDSIFRHILAYMGGETIDPESGCRHMAHVMCRAAFAIEYDMTAPTVEPEKQDPCDGTLRDALDRGDEMPAWLIELITSRTDAEFQYGNNFVAQMFDWGKSPDPFQFWDAVMLWQMNEGPLPEEPKP